MTVLSRLGTWLIVPILFISMAVFAADINSGTNRAPLADAGLARSVVVGEVVTLDASGSTDWDGDRLKFHWSLRTPPGSGARLSNANALRPQFTVDLLGKYTAELIVSDGKLDSVADAVMISTGNVAPVAIITMDTNVTLGEAVVLDGSASWDFNDDPLDYHWSLIGSPTDSRASLQSSRSMLPSFVADAAGDYRVELTVSDGRYRSETVQILLSTVNSRPHADAGVDRSTYTGKRLRLNGRGSIDADGEPLKYRWKLLHVPQASHAVLNATDSATPALDVDAPGLYLIQLITHDGIQASTPDTMVITADEPPAAFNAVTRLGGMDVDGDGIPDDVDNCAEHFNPSQLDSNSDGFGNRCDADLDNDGFITNFGDLFIWTDAFNSTPISPNWNQDADFNGDNTVNFLDLFIFTEFFLMAPGPIVNEYINPAGGTWHDPANWSLGVLPNTTHSARIAIGAGVSVEYSTGDSEIAALRSSTDLLLSGGGLTVNGDMQVNAAVTLSGGGTLADANILAPTTSDEIVLTSSEAFTLENVTLGADLTIENGGDMRVNDDLTLSSNATITLASDNSFTYLRFLGVAGTSSTLGGSGSVVFGGTTALSDRNNIEVFNGGDGLVVESGITIRTDTASGRLDHRFNNGPITIQGTVIADLAARQVVVDASPLSIEGMLQVSNTSLMDVFFRGAGGTITSSAMLSASTGGELYLHGEWASEGTITVTDATLDLGNAVTEAWDNNGSIVLSNATLELGGFYTVADIGTVNGTGTVILNGTLDNTGMTLDTGVDLPGTTVELGGGGILLGGSVVNTPLVLPASTSFTLDNVTLGADLTIENGGDMRVNDDLTLSSNATITLASDNSFTYLRFLGVAGTSSTLGGSGSVVFGGTTALSDRNNIEVFNGGDGLVVESGITIRTDTASGRLDHRFNNGPITIQGTVIADLAARQVVVDASPLSIEGMLQVSNTSLMDVFFRGAGGTITSSAMLSASTGGELYLHGEWASEGTITVTDATLDLGGALTEDWDNNGSIVLSNATLELGGFYTVADIGTVTGTGTVILNGTLDNTGMTLDTGVDLPGTTVELGNGGILLGGSVVNTPLVLPVSTSFTLDNVTLGADLTIENGGDMRVNDDLTLSSNATITLASDNSFTYLRFLGVAGTSSTLGGSGSVVFGGTTALSDRNNIEVFNGGDGLVVESGITIRTDTASGRLDHRFNNGPITVQGTVIADLAARQVVVDASPLSIEGMLQVSNTSFLDVSFRGAGGTITSSAMLSASTGGELYLHGEWASEGTITVTDATLDLGGALTEDWDNNGSIVLSNATLELGGFYTVTDIGTVTGTGTVILNGTLDNTGMTLDTGVDLPGTTVELGGGGIILGGSVVNTPLVLPASTSFTLDNVTLGADLTIENGGDMRVNDDLTLSSNATITLASDNSFTYLRFLGVAGTSSTLGGSGSVVFGGTTALSDRNNIEVFNNGDGLVVESGITIRTDTASGRLDHRFNNGPITIQGTVIADLAARQVVVDASPLSIEGMLQVSNTSLMDVFFRGAGGTITSSAMLSASTGGELYLHGEWASEGTITVTAATLDLGGAVTEAWDNNGSIVFSNATLELGGFYTVADIGTVNGTGTVILNGTLDNTGMTLDTGVDLPGTTVELGGGGIILGGSVVNTPLVLPASTSFTLDNVTLGADLTIENGGDMRVNDDLTLSSNATITLASDNSITYLRFLGVAGTSSTLGGSGSVVFGGTTALLNRNNIEVFNNGDGLVVESGITIRTDTASGRLDHRFNNGPITVQGTVIADTVARQITVDAAPLSIAGTLRAGAGSVINFNSDYSLTSTAVLNVDIGGTATTDFGRFTAVGRTANLDGTMDTLNITLVDAFVPSLGGTFEIMTFASRSGTFGTENGTDIGGGLFFQVNYNATDVTLEVVN